MQADTTLIEARAKVQLADEYDVAQEWGEVARLEKEPASARTTLTSCPAAGVMGDQAGAASSRVGRS